MGCGHYRQSARGSQGGSGIFELMATVALTLLPAGRTLDRKGMPLLIKLKGTVEAYYR